MVLELGIRPNIEPVTINNGIQVFKDLALMSYHRISSHQLPNGLIPASVGRYDDRHFANHMVWVKDHVRAARFPLDPFVQRHFPQIAEDGKNLYLKATRGILRVQTQPEQRARFAQRPGDPDETGYSTIDDQKAPAIKFTKQGYIYYDWGHNQPDNWGTLLLGTGKGIEEDWPVLKRAKDGFAPGEVLQDIISYALHLRVESFRCRSIWEHDKVKASYSTIRIVWAGLSQMDRTWAELAKNARDYGFPLAVSRDQIQQATGRLEEKVRLLEGDITDSAEKHPSTADLASLVVLNDVDNLPIAEAEAALKRIYEGGLENRDGFYRFKGDPWKHGSTEAKWTMGKPILANYFFRRADQAYRANLSELGDQALTAGLDRINSIIDILSEHGYIPELFEDEDGDGKFRPNNNELAWTHSYIIQAAASGIAAIKACEMSH